MRRTIQSGGCGCGYLEKFDVHVFVNLGIFSRSWMCLLFLYVLGICLVISFFNCCKRIGLELAGDIWCLSCIVWPRRVHMCMNVNPRVEVSMTFWFFYVICRNYIYNLWLSDTPGYSDLSEQCTRTFLQSEWQQVTVPNYELQYSFVYN